MKIVTRLIPEFQERHLFAPIRTKLDYARAVATCSRILLIENGGVIANHTDCRLKLIIDKMSRIFLYRNNKYISFSYPFSVRATGNEIESITTYSGDPVDHESIAALFSILETLSLRNRSSLLDMYTVSDELAPIGVGLLEEIVQSEPGYIRYDDDPENAKGKRHPHHHLDINYTTYATYKIGLKAKLVQSVFEDIVNTSSDCSYFE